MSSEEEHADASQPTEQPSSSDASQPTELPPDVVTLEDACKIAQAEVQRLARGRSVEAPHPTPATLKDVLRSWRLGGHSDEKCGDDAPPVEAGSWYMTREDACAIAEAQVQSHFMSRGFSWDEVQRWKR